MSLTVRFRTPPGQTIRRILLTWERLFALLGLIAITTCGFMLGFAKLSQAYDSWSFDQQVQGNGGSITDYLFHLIGRPASRGLSYTSNPAPKAPAEEPPRIIGRLEIPSIDLTAMILRGTDEWTLNSGAGHIEGTALPWEPGNCAIAAHRDGLFRPLRRISKGDGIRVTTSKGIHDYQVESIQIVEPGDTSVLSASVEPTMTLITCYPFSYVGEAPRRFVVTARRFDPDEPVVLARNREARERPAPTRRAVAARLKSRTQITDLSSTQVADLSNEQVTNLSNEQVTDLSSAQTEESPVRRRPAFIKRLGRLFSKPFTALRPR